MDSVAITNKRYPHDLSFFLDMPEGDSNLMEIEDWSVERLKVLMIFIDANDQGFACNSHDWGKYILEKLFDGKHMDYVHLLFHPNYTSTVDDIKRRQKDALSHHMLVLTFCLNDDKRSCLMQFESDMFRLKFINLTDIGIREFMKINQFLKVLSKEEKNKYREELLLSTAPTGFNTKINKIDMDFDSTDFYRVKHAASPQLLADLCCYVEQGWLFVPHYNLIYVLEDCFRAHLKKRLSSYDSVLRYGYDDQRLIYMMQNIYDESGSFSKLDAGYSSDHSVTLASLDQLPHTSFPLCSRNLYDMLKHFHHLQYNGRQLLQHFLKGIGLSVQDCMDLFRNEMIKNRKFDDAKFDVQYGYYIRHNYGLEGSRIQFQPPDCMKVMDTTIPVGQKQLSGCPFKQPNPSLVRRLNQCNVSSEGITEIMKLAKQGHAQIACSKFFKFTHNGTPVAIKHPNQFFTESRKYYTAKDRQLASTNQADTSTSTQKK